MAREGIHPETPRVPYTPGWDLVGTVDQLGEAVTGFELCQEVAAMPIHACYAQYVCVPRRKLVPIPAGLDAAEAVAVVLNYVTAYQMLHRSAKARSGQRMLIHGGSGSVGTATLQLASLAGIEMYGTCSGPSRTAQDWDRRTAASRSLAIKDKLECFCPSASYCPFRKLLIRE